MTAKQWMIYGANGYTGRLITEVAARRGLRPILAGRNRQEIEAMASEFSMDSRVFDLAEMSDNLAGVSALLLAAGPFVHTSEIAVKACLAAKIHYLDITGEIAVFEAVLAKDEAAKAAGCVLMPGVGFDVVPSDCLAASLAEAMPDATELHLAFSGGQLSKGTAKTMVTHIAGGGSIREHGRIVQVPLAYHDKDIPFHDKSRRCMTIPWGDVSTAYFSTGIENIRVYSKSGKSQIRNMRRLRRLVPILGLAPVQRLLMKIVDAKVQGPDSAARTSRKTELWGQVRNAAGKTISATLTTTEGYSLTAECAVESVMRIDSVAAGYQTPSTGFGAAFISEFPGCTLRIHL